MSESKLKIVFFGSSYFSRDILNTLIEAGFPIAGIVTQPDRKSGRGLQLLSTPVKEFAQKKGLEVFVAEDALPERLKTIKPDLFVVVAYGRILSEEILKIPRLYAVNIHASLLPKYRGAAPIAQAIIKGEKISGVTIIRMNEKMDAGEIITQKEISIEMADNAISLEEKLSSLAQRQILETLKLIEEGKAAFYQQDSTQATYVSKLNKEDGRIDWSKEALSIYNQIRGCLSWPIAFTYLGEKRLKIFKAKVSQREAKGSRVGEIVSLEQGLITVACGKDAIEIEELQSENSKRMKALDFILGARIKVGEVFR